MNLHRGPGPVAVQQTNQAITNAMNTPNPLVPQGSMLEQKAKRKTTLTWFVIIFAVHAVVLGGILIAGCKPDGTKDAGKGKSPGDGNLAIAPMTNTAPPEFLNPVPSVTPVTNPVPTGITPPPTLVTTSAPPVVPITTQITTPGSEPAPPAAPKEHVVAKGDMLVNIAKKYGVTLAALEKANPGVDPKKIKPGQKLVIPAKEEAAKNGKKEGAPDTAPKSDEYVVKSGDNLGNIAKAHGTTVKAIKELNGLSTDQIKVGQKLKLPPANGKKASGSVPAPAPAPEGLPIPAPAPAPVPAPITPTPGNN